MFTKFKVAAALVAIIAVLPGIAQVSEAADTVDARLVEVMQWRSIGPYRGGRVTAVSGVVGDPQVYYMGATGGGVWKTENAGVSWRNVSDGYFGVGTIGAIAVAESDPNVLYVGTGEKSIRGVTTSQGDGMYKSVDGGTTWQHVGLRNAGQISRIKVHPANPDIAYAAVQGQIWAPNPERGVYRTVDGGKTWQPILQVDAKTGASDLRMDPANPRILYAAMWEHGRKPWYMLSGGDTGGIFKSTDGGDTWRQLTEGLPKRIGKIGIDVSANPQRLYAIVEAAAGEGGLYRSDDGGDTWQLKNGTRILWGRSWYYMHIAADPLDENVVYVLNAPFMKSIDGGVTFEMRSTPHGDHHDHWINPRDSMNMINGNDGGAAVTFDGGKSWSSIMNQPTAQIYRVNADNGFPYRIYSGQQDNWSLAILSETFIDGIGHDDYHRVGGGESAHFAFDVDDPRLVYGTSVNGTLTEYDAETRLVRQINPYPEYLFGNESRALRYRSNWNAPVAVSPQNPATVYYGTQKVLQTTDRGATFTEISPDLTRNETDKQGLNGGPFTVENFGGEFYGTILTITPSPHEQGTVWAGSDDGLIHVTRDNGKTWDNVTPGGHEGAMVNAIDVSPHEPGTAYVAITGYKLNDFRPYVYKLTEFGRRATRLDRDLPADNFIRVVREDPDRKGLLYAGGETGMHVSFDDGRHWQSLRLNLPQVPVTDLIIRQGDLVAATQGRGIWILDDLSAVRQASPELSEKPLHVFSPGPVEMIPPGGSPLENEGANPPRGAVIRYFIREALDEREPLFIEISDSSGELVRRYSSVEDEFERCIIGNKDQRLPFEVEYPTVRQGANTWVWDLRRQNLTCIEDIKVFEGLSGAYVPPGDYVVKVMIAGYAATAPVTLVHDRRGNASDQQWLSHEATVVAVTNMMNEIIEALGQARRQRKTMEALLENNAGNAALNEAVARAIDRLNDWERTIYQIEYETYEDIGHLAGKLIKRVRHLLGVIDGARAPVSAAALERFAELESQWSVSREELRSLQVAEIAEVNELAKKYELSHIPVLAPR